MPGAGTWRQARDHRRPQSDVPHVEDRDRHHRRQRDAGDAGVARAGRRAARRHRCRAGVAGALRQTFARCKPPKRRSACRSGPHVAARTLRRRRSAHRPRRGRRAFAPRARRRGMDRAPAGLARRPRRAVRHAAPGDEVARRAPGDVRLGHRRPAADRDDSGRRAVPARPRARPAMRWSGATGGGSRACASPGTATAGTASRCTGTASGGASRTRWSRSSPSALRGAFSSSPRRAGGRCGSTSAAATCWSWAVHASARGATAYRR